MNDHKLFPILALGSFFLIWLYGHNLLWAAEKEYPNHPIKMIVPYTPGGIVDQGSRITADYLAQELKVPVIIENKPGQVECLVAPRCLKPNRMDTLY